MAKDRIESPPELIDISQYNNNKQFLDYVSKYQAVDQKGRYLHWNEFKWRIDETDNKVMAWHATKFNRRVLLKQIELLDKKNNKFQFCIPESLQSKLYQITKRIGSGGKNISNTKAASDIQETFLVSSLLMEEAISSAQLEGANTTRRIAKDMLETERPPKNEDEQMVINNFLLMKEAKNRCNEPLSIELILDFHRIATLGTTKNSVIPGEFRQDDDVCIADGLEGTIVHQPPDFIKIPSRMKTLCEFTNNEHASVDSTIFIEPIVKAIILHFMIGYEHPFADGNGRTARALFYWFLLKSGYQLFEYIPISKLLKKAPIKYGSSYLRTETDDNDLTYFIYYQVEIILRAINEFVDYLKLKTQEYYELMDWFENSKINSNLNNAQRIIIKKAVKNPGRVFTVKEIKNDFGVVENTARDYLNRLVKLKLLAKSKDGRTTLYIAPANLKEKLTKA